MLSVCIVHDYISDWRRMPEAAELLGVSISTLWRWRRSGHLRAGVHWLRTSPGRRGCVMLNLPACVLLLQVRTADQHCSPAALR